MFDDSQQVPILQERTKYKEPLKEPASLEPEIDPDDPNLTTPIPRYNTMLAVLRNTLYMSVTILSYLFLIFTGDTDNPVMAGSSNAARASIRWMTFIPFSSRRWINMYV